MANENKIAKGPDIADLPLILQDLLDRIEARRTAGGCEHFVGELEAEYHQLRGE